MHVLQMVLLVRESVYIVHYMVHILVGLEVEVEVEASSCVWHLTWCSSWIDGDFPKSYCLISASHKDQFSSVVYSALSQVKHNLVSRVKKISRVEMSEACTNPGTMCASVI